MPQIRRLIIRTIESSTINRDSNITDTVTLSETLSMYSTKTLGPRMEPWETPVLTRYSCKVFPSRTTRSSLLMSNDKLGQIPDLKFHKTWVCVEDQQAKPSRKPWIYQVLQFYQIQMSQDLQLNEKNWNHTGNQQEGFISQVYQQLH